MHTNSKKISLILLALLPLSFLLVTLSACSKDKSKSPAPKAEATAAQDAQANADTAQAPQALDGTEINAPDAAKAIENAPKADAAPIEFPKLDARSAGSEKDENGNEISITYFANADEPGKREMIESQIREAGFTLVPGGSQTNYEKVQGDQVVMIEITEGEGELQITMTRTRDPQNRYKDADPRIPYPLDQGFAAEFGKQKAGDEGDMIYTFYNRSPDFLTNYENRLVAAGFKIVRNDARPLYTKKINDNLTLTVLVIKLNEHGSDVKIVMGAVSQEADLADNDYDIE